MEDKRFGSENHDLESEYFDDADAFYKSFIPIKDEDRVLHPDNMSNLSVDRLMDLF